MLRRPKVQVRPKIQGPVGRNKTPRQDSAPAAAVSASSVSSNLPTSPRKEKSKHDLSTCFTETAADFGGSGLEKEKESDKCQGDPDKAPVEPGPREEGDLVGSNEGENSLAKAPQSLTSPANDVGSSLNDTTICTSVLDLEEAVVVEEGKVKQRDEKEYHEDQEEEVEEEEEDAEEQQQQRQKHKQRKPAMSQKLKGKKSLGLAASKADASDGKESESVQRTNRRNKAKAAANKMLGPLDKSKVTVFELLSYNPPLSDEQKERRKKSDQNSNSETIVFADIEEVEEKEPEKDAEIGPRVKVGANGEIILDEESLVVKKKSIISDSTIFENNKSMSSAATYSSFRNRPSSGKKPRWSDEETVRFYNALAVIGTDFSLMASLWFTGKRTRLDLRNKFKKEERVHKVLIENTLKISSLNNHELMDRLGDSASESDPEFAPPVKVNALVDEAASGEPVERPKRKAAKANKKEPQAESSQSVGEPVEEEEEEKKVKPERKRRRKVAP